MGYKRVIEKSHAALQGMSLVSVKLESARQLLCHGRERRSMALLAPLLPAGRPGGRPRTTDIRAVINAIFYLLRTGGKPTFLH